MLQLKLKLFAHPRELLSSSEVEITILEGATLLDLREALSRLFPGLAPILPSCSFALSEELIQQSQEGITVIDGTLDLALIPPVSGG
jgi:molybdopterin synthase sulfur carrier subunit